MTNSPFFAVVKSIMWRGWLLYVIAAFLAVRFVDYSAMASHAYPVTLSRLRPDHRSVADIVDGNKSFEQRPFEDLRIYLENVDRIMGDRVDTNVLLAFTLHRLGDKKRSQQLFEHALEQNPTFFWTYYCLALIALEKGDADQAFYLLRKTTILDVQDSMTFLLQSKIFMSFVVDAGYTPQKYYENLIKGQANAYKLLVKAAIDSKNFGEALQFAQAGLRQAVSDVDRAFFLYELGIALLERKDLASAAQAFGSCLKIDPDHVEALTHMAIVLKMVGRDRGATVFQQKAVEAKKVRLTALPSLDSYQLRVF